MSKNLDALTTYGSWSRAVECKSDVADQYRAPQKQKELVVVKFRTEGIIIPNRTTAKQFGGWAQQADAAVTPLCVTGLPERRRDWEGEAIGSQLDDRGEHFHEWAYTHEIGHVSGRSYQDWHELRHDPLVQYEASLASLRKVIAGLFKRSPHTPQLRQHGQSGSFLFPKSPDDANMIAQPSERLNEKWWNTLVSDDSPLQDRIAALDELLVSDSDNAARFVVESLCRDDISAQWRNALVLIVETIQLCDEQLRECLAKRLYDLAVHLRQTAEQGINPIVHSAIRCYASMIPMTDSESLLTFLEPPRPVETRLVTLQCIVHLFEAEPPQNADSHQRLADRISELAEKFLDRDWLIAGEKAAIGQNATFALAAIGDARLGPCIETVCQLEMRWLTRQIQRKLESLYRNWSDKPSLTQHRAVKLVQEQLAILRSQSTGSY